jgi:hypothetical protein
MGAVAIFFLFAILAWLPFLTAFVLILGGSDDCGSRT